MKPRLYIETTIPSYLVARPSPLIRIAADQQTTREWWEQRRGEYELFTSAIVLDESSVGDAAMADARFASLSGIPLLDENADAKSLSRHLLEESIIPAVAAPDAFHLAIAAVHRMDFLLTWNCKHLHNPHLERRIEAACHAHGWESPVICTPAELMEISTNG
jgi:hypothetical protein